MNPYMNLLILQLLVLAFISATTATLSEEESSQNMIRPFSELEKEPGFVKKSKIQPFYHCETSVKTPEHNLIETYQVDLDLPPEKRWTDLVIKKKLPIVALMNYVKNFTTHLIGKSFMKLVDITFPYLTKTLPVTYREEIEGISKALDMEPGELALYNLFYEFFSVCTSIVVQVDNGTIYHGRNLDFGLLLGWDSKKKTWLATELLRPLIVQVEFVHKGQVLYRSINYAGYIGILTAVKKGQFALSINERFRVNGGFVGIAEWILGFRKQSWLGVITRQVMENCDTYLCAQKWLSQPTLIAPVYFILSGSKPSEGCIITRGRSSSKITRLGSLQKHQNASWYLVQTNYDQWEQCPSYDDRNTPSLLCMEKLGRDDVIHTLTNVLSTRPVLNKLTTYTALMSAELDMLMVWIQHCPDPCWPW